MKFKVWLDSGVNAYSCYEDEITLEELGFTEKEWDELSEEDKSNEMKNVAFASSDWGYTPIDE